MIQHTLPADIERTSLSIIRRELQEKKIVLPQECAAVIERVIHTTADFDYAQSLYFSENAVCRGVEALSRGAHIITDTNMAYSGISKPSLRKLGGEAHCFMADEEVARSAKEHGTTRADASMIRAAREYPDAVFAVGNAPTALLRLETLINEGLRPAMIIAVPVGFVNVVESKERIVEAGEKTGVPVIAAMGRKGGSNVAAAICNALLYTAAGTLEPSRRGWSG